MLHPRALIRLTSSAFRSSLIQCRPRAASSSYVARASSSSSSSSRHLCNNTDPFTSGDSFAVVRQLEMLNVLVGYEQVNRYAMRTPDNRDIGYIVEDGKSSILRSLTRNVLLTRRPMAISVLDLQGRRVAYFRRPLRFINSYMHTCSAPQISNGRHSFPDATSRSQKTIIPPRPLIPNHTADSGVSCEPITNDEAWSGLVEQEWHLLRRRYNLFAEGNVFNTKPIVKQRAKSKQDTTSNCQINQDASASPLESPNLTQFGRIDEPMLWWEFDIKDENGGVIARIDRKFRGFARELFTDTGCYSIDYSRDLTREERIVVLGAAIAIDVDYFSRARGGFMSPGFFFIPTPFGGIGGVGGELE